ncbi:uncharacterized protein si:ch211-13c6.2 isoform X2 [Anabas testudineus]|uniref:C2H2-type domain-containing protein n=1 Tax=Anabas testudineus TaxID=64144 RepID=A0A3Q1IN79_ANATE|nr:uncharacterized protein si:ch211-13c6.2 isoform X2 [Anabas testudineus]
MENLETPYEEETEFVECTVCEKSLRGETLYKIHLTTPGHIKKEDSIVAAGRAVRRHIVPEFTDILQYLDYLNLDEPIIGLSFLDEVPCNDPPAGPRYLCRLCHHTANLAEMVHHVIGRKHRQKYVELKRPDLVTWDKQSIITQGGKIIRARAEIIERQDGRGSPLTLVKRGHEVAPREKQNGNQNISQRSTQRNIPPLLPELGDCRNEYSNRVKHPTGYPNTLQFQPDESDQNRDRKMYQRDDTLRRNYMEDELHRADYRESNTYRREYVEPDNRLYAEDPLNLSSPRAVLEPGGVPIYHSREEMSLGQAQLVECYPDKAPSYKRPYPENDPLKEFYSEEVRRRQNRSAEYQPSQRVFQDDERQWSLQRESGRHDNMIRLGRQGSSESEAKKGSLPIPMESELSQDHLFNIIRDYRHERRETHLEDAMSSSGQGRTGLSTCQRQVTRTMSDIPEPFRRFLKGDDSDERQSKRRKKSRFSDATAQEVEMTKEMFTDEHGPPTPKFGGHPRAFGALFRPEIHGTQQLDTESQSPHHTGSYQRGSFGSEGVFDMLKNIEIENAEDADFLKNKLCSLLKEFKSRKSEKDVQNSQGRALTNNNYISLKADHDTMSPRYHYERNHREDSDLRRPEIYFKEDHRGRGWKEHNKQHIEYHDLGGGEPRCSDRSHYEEPFGWTEMSQTPQTDGSHYPERFQEPMHPYDSKPAAEKYFDFHTSATPLHVEQEPRMHRDSRYSRNLDKITSTLLELVARK